jgi:hypothetical protein
MDISFVSKKLSKELNEEKTLVKIGLDPVFQYRRYV